MAHSALADLRTSTTLEAVPQPAPVESQAEPVESVAPPASAAPTPDVPRPWPSRTGKTKPGTPPPPAVKTSSPPLPTEPNF